VDGDLKEKVAVFHKDTAYRDYSNAQGNMKGHGWHLLHCRIGNNDMVAQCGQ
jgi:hypothetical protein